MKKVVTLLLISLSLFGAELHFDTFKKLSGVGHTLLIIGGIHGDEPGGYFAPSVIVTHYKVKKGNLVIIPNLNADSIVANQRGIYGDMNRKFANVDSKDPDYKIVNDIKNMILDKNVDLILNLHDGRGFFRNSWQNSIFNPSAWGQAYIIDQKEINNSKFGNLDAIVQRVIENLNKNLEKEHHIFNIKNTETKFKDEEMKHSLTYFAITNNRPALAIETSKNIEELCQKVLYQLRSIEEFMKIMEIEYERDFELNLNSIKKIIYDFGTLNINGNIELDLNSVRKNLNFIPLNNNNKNDFSFSSPIGKVKKDGDNYNIYIGNILITTLKAQYFYPNCDLSEVEFIIDGKNQKVKVGSTINVKKDFLIKDIKDIKGIRVNVIGFVTQNRVSQDNVLIEKGDILSRFSLDENSKTYRVEFYKENNFCGMINVKFE